MVSQRRRELPRAVIRFPQCKNTSQFVLFVERGISVSGPRGQFCWPPPGSCPGPGACAIWGHPPCRGHPTPGSPPPESPGSAQDFQTPEVGGSEAPRAGRGRDAPGRGHLAAWSVVTQGLAFWDFFPPSIGKTHEIKSTTFAVVRHPVRGRGTVTLLCGRHHRRPQSFPTSQTRLCPQETLAPQPRAPSPGSLGSGGGRRAWRVSSRAVGRPAHPHRPSLLWPGPGRRGELPVSCLSPPMNAEAAAR